MTTKASDNSGNRVTIQSSIEDILGYELALHIFRMLKIEESAQEASINNIAELHELLSDRAENLSYVQSQAEFQGLDCMFRPIPITHFGSIRSLISV